MIDLENLQVEAGGRTILRAPNWRLDAGSEALVLGPSGAGKTTLLNVISGILRPTQGRATVLGQDLYAMNEGARDRFRGGKIGIVFQTIRLVRSLSVAENLALALRLSGKTSTGGAILEALARVGIDHLAKAMPARLSVGESQRAAIARALVTRPRLILADEPTSALDDENATRVLGLLQSGARDFGAGLVIVTHDQRLKSAIANQLVLERAP
jgi:putative ABC transport system ATP-binding protein